MLVYGKLIIRKLAYCDGCAEMYNVISRYCLSALAFVFAIVIAVSATADDGHLVNKDEDDVAIAGYDTVAYFAKSQPMKGKSEHTHTWQGAEWWFVSAEHRDMFAAAPEHYAPRYGGYCAMAMAQGLVATVDPEAWVIVKGRLYLNYSKHYREQFVEDDDDAIKAADNHWESIQSAD